ncbi:TPA: outer membrane lipoprotein-sorting protein [Escherichia coli]|uniref:outer membrane lipoprotein-sorting protein n=1 Tax=Escherichia coli TaxID=562 RepID=UPI0006A62117|nr:outer membrane lipoprotein-sorting protein [Escherichia coli]EES0673227.1 outer membrane lipoprotein-sorting protein [Escherichia coli]EEU3603924.1 outer membrane lipoprotein-sorting protein [Escherichia coli]EEZ2196457.1 outer membrane lipoprotein-sorting protein [Escherichia coli]EFC2502440.1 outer membrane lipoprotein-sorting protein [Escherichia coli]EFS2096123.1 outer membrane lipoprotein-sorting protein [Escherichia coli]
MNMAFYGKWFACLWLATSCVQAASTDDKALEIIRRADEIRSPNKPFRYTLTVTEYKAGATQPENKQVLDISMRFMKPQGNEKADARSLVRFIYPPRDKGKIMLSDWYDLWFYTPELRRPMPISRQQRLIGQISNGDVIVTNFEYAYDSTLVGEVSCAEKQCYKLALVRKSADITWPKVIYYVEKDGDNRPWKAAYYSQDEQLIKEVLYQDFQPVLGKTRPMKITVTDVRHGNNYSVMEYSDVRLESLPEFHFTKEYIQRGAK